MMEPRIQYTKTSDGVSIAFWTLGEGTPLLVTPSGPSAPSLSSWQTPEGRAYYERLARDRLLIRYDHRGCGHSERNISDQSLGTLVADLEAVADQAGFEEFALLGNYACAPFAIAYAARHPGRITKLILYNTSALGSDLFNQDRLQKARESADDDPEFYLQIVAHEMLDWTVGEQMQSLVSDFIKEVDPRALQMTMDTIGEADVTDLLPQVAAPTLVLHRRKIRYPSLDAARALAAGIPGAQLLVLEGGDVRAPYFGDVDLVASTIDDFLADGEKGPAPAATPTGLVTILFTDMESSTALRRRLGDAQAQELVRAHNEIVRDALKASGGKEIKHTGDGIMASFTTATSALQCAIAIQQGVAAHVEEQPGSPLGVYVGLNAGEPIAEEQDLFGTSVDLAARICDHAQPGQILASNVVRELSEGKGFLFGDIGDVVPKGFEEPVRLYEVRWGEERGTE